MSNIRQRGMTLVPLLLWGVLLVFTGCGNVESDGGSSSPKTGQIRGTVINAISLLRLAGANVVATQDGEPVGAVSSAENGTFNLEDIPPGPTQLTASLDGFTSDPVTVEVVIGKTVTDVVLAIRVPGNEIAFVLTTNGVNGTFSTINLDDRGVTPSVAPVGRDPQARLFNGFVYVINRAPQNNIQVLDPQNNFVTVRQFITGANSNPHDIAFVSAEKAYVTRYDQQTLLVLNPLTERFLNEIDLSPFADADGIPDMDQMVIVGNRLYVSLQRINRNNFFPTDVSLLVVIDTLTDRIIESIELTGTNPVTQLVFDQANNRILVGEAGDPFLLDGGIDVIDVATNQATGFLIREVTLGGDLSAFVLLSEEKGYAVVGQNVSSLVAFSPRTGGFLGTLLTTPEFSLAALAVNDRNELFVGDRDSFTPGIRIFNTTTDREITVLPMNVGFPPAAPPNAILFF